MLKLTKEELREVERIKVFQKRIYFSRFALIAFLFVILVTSITNIISSSDVLIGTVVGILIFETNMLRYNNADDLLKIIQKNLSPYLDT